MLILFYQSSYIVFAYGMTGTGKTHTMTGELDNPTNQGIVPRAVYQVFKYLESISAEYSVRISVLELYNEVLTDLLVDTPGEETKLRLVSEMEETY